MEGTCAGGSSFPAGPDQEPRQAEEDLVVAGVRAGALAVSPGISLGDPGGDTHPGSAGTLLPALSYAHSCCFFVTFVLLHVGAL